MNLRRCENEDDNDNDKKVVNGELCYDSSQNHNDDVAFLSQVEDGLCGDDSDSDSAELELDDGYDDDLMGDEKDRAMLNSMTEVEREKELFKRMERREALQARLMIVRRLKAARKRKAGDDSDSFNDVLERPEREKTNAVKTSLAKLKESRLQKSKTDRHRRTSSDSQHEEDDGEIEAVSKRDALRERYLLGNFEEDSDEEFTDTFAKKTVSVPINTLEQFNQLRISRHKLILWIHQPFFEEKIPGFFVKFYSNNPTANECPYHAYEIMQVLKSNKTYKFGEFLTNKVLRIKRGNEERVIRMEYVSNQSFTEEEFESYCRVMDENNFPLPRVDFVERKLADLKHCIYFRPTEKDIDHIVSQKNQFRSTPINCTTEKAKLLDRIGRATLEGDDNLVQQLRAKVVTIDKELERQQDQRSKNLEKVRLINEKNRRCNADHYHRILEAQQLDDNSNDNANNPFVRRRTNPINMMDKNVHATHAKSSNLLQTTQTTSNGLVAPTNNSSTKLEPDLTDTNNTSNKFSCADDPLDISKDLENLYNFDLDLTF